MNTVVIKESEGAGEENTRKAVFILHIKRRKIDVKKAEQTLQNLDEQKDESMSLGKFIQTYFDTLSRSGRTIKEIHEYLKTNDIDVGSYEGFRRAYYRRKVKLEEKKQEPKSFRNHDKKKEEKSIEALTPEKIGVEEKRTKSKSQGLGLRPIYAADGKTELKITENGAKTFEI